MAGQEITSRYYSCYKVSWVAKFASLNLSLQKSDYCFLFSNHSREPNSHVMRFLERHEIPYHYLATIDRNKGESDVLDLVQDTDFLVLARYMQVFILSSIYSSYSCKYFCYY